MERHASKQPSLLLSRLLSPSGRALFLYSWLVRVAPDDTPLVTWLTLPQPGPALVLEPS